MISRIDFDFTLHLDRYIQSGYREENAHLEKCQSDVDN